MLLTELRFKQQRSIKITLIHIIQFTVIGILIMQRSL